ncbi:phosphoribosylamine--glycine ligase [candidate division WOR-1 bacterium RIFOXYA12_FULL_43_27]|uniref:Phosphoribosylamine--glycine ligase n=1 Tax=candidate division WOR-1 bacterium RIFOXYC2_FULL_46_14 TaxID=1802587 RepID=A0A1F4U8X7_UNCSA|nr:MAG: phosphoribosylamine--glycine ligase [candidate division WOR-1 bacterium RIFOXYA12_FULL_43_27]OGC19153.1 MAG: phosphoribosylamine--glycine ligase [candidate division WOR-1 bacterium RIFOXYB2_FULL_46_45]OGC30141.1 MAG: phosphoribosylamine--glycine ligase [candidate division WOR-1 bacterium RIFOXYA2_FULL_46_56]OGC40743.1 MAG: phosphoribosylamine--glycine ligase [candidate division WOR-1 bacterium RIFOXYC2_FULL_46_14]
MKVLIIGSGGREHTLAWKISQSPKLTKLYCAPGNAGTAIVAENVPIADNDIAGLKDFAVKNSIDLTIVGPEIPLVMGIVDEFEAAGLKIFGPSKAAAKIEGSKIFAKNLMHKYNIPTAEAIVYEKVEDALNFVKKVGTPIVIKVDGLAAGKGVFVAKDQKEAEEAVKRILVDKEFGAAGNKIIVEECLKGEEVSILAITDGETILPLASAQDHKRVFDRDEGPNTGGMGAYSPAPIATSELLNMVQEKVLKKTVAALKEAGIIYKGILYCGLMMTASGPMVLEFNCRFGDPETQVILPRMKNDLLEVILSTLDSRLSTIALDWDPRSAVCVVLAAGGYPGNYEKGIEIKGLDNVKDGVVFHAGTKAVDVKITTNGGRVLGVVGLGAPLKEAIRKAYDAVKQINFDKMHFRKDIGAKALK